MIGSIRRECTDHISPLGERHPVSVLRRYAIYYNESRTHLALDRNSPSPCFVDNGAGEIVAILTSAASTTDTLGPRSPAELATTPDVSSRRRRYWRTV